MTLSIGGVTIKRSLVWADRDAWQQLGQSRARTVGGGQVVFTGPLAGGRPITLEARRGRGWLEHDEVTALRALAAVSGATYVLVFGSDSYDVEFDHEPGPAVDVAAFLPRQAPAADDPYFGTIRLRTV